MFIILPYYYTNISQCIYIMENSLIELNNLFINKFKEINELCIKRFSKICSDDMFLYLSRLIEDHKNSSKTVVTNLQAEKLCDTTPDAFIKKRKIFDPKYFNNLSIDLESYYYKNCNNFTINGYLIYAVDGVHCQLPYDLTYQGYKTTKGDKYCDVLLSGLYDVCNKIPIDLNIGVTKNERESFEDQYSLLDNKVNVLPNSERLKHKSIILFDRGYYADWLLHDIYSLNVHALFRLKVDSRFVQQLLKSRRRTGIFDITLNGIVKKMRVVIYNIKGKLYFLGTTLLDKNEFSTNDLKKLYAIRWNIEESFKTIKDLSFRFFHSKSESLIKQEIAIHKCIIILTRIIEELYIKCNKINMTPGISC